MDGEARTAGGKPNWHIGEEAHAERAESRDGSSASDEVTSNDIEAQVVFGIVTAGWIDGIVADASTTGIGDDGGIDLLVARGRKGIRKSIQGMPEKDMDLIPR
jgi:hypothetical protein